VVYRARYDGLMERVFDRTVCGLAAEGIDYRGFFYAGLMIGADGVPRVLEYNCRLGDPETQPIMMRLQSDLVDLCQAALEGGLGDVEARWDPRASLGVVMAAEGYPFEYRKGHVIEGLEQPFGDATRVFHAGTRIDDGKVVTDGGRVLCVTALGDNVSAARDTAYAACARISWPGAFYRRDIGHRAVARERSARR